MLSTTLSGLNANVTQGHDHQSPENALLRQRYQDIIQNKRLNWTSHHRLRRLLGTGGQGTVYLSERRGTDGFTVPVALKVFSPDRYEDEHSYDEAMHRIADIAAHVAQIQHDNLLYVHNFVDRNRIRMMVMEWIDGYDLQRLLVPERMQRIEQRVSRSRWEHLNNVLLTAGRVHPRFKPGVAVAIVRDCLAALAALHREGIVHGDIKPANIMLKRTGSAKIVDVGSAFAINAPPPQLMCTLRYAAPEVLENRVCTPLSDLASLGYVLIELLAGQPPFVGDEPKSLRDLLEQKRRLPQRLHEILPYEVVVNTLLTNFCRRMIALDPNKRFPSAEDADLVEGGAAAFHRQLIMSNMASEYTNDIRVWLQELRELDELDDPSGSSGFSESEPPETGQV